MTERVVESSFHVWTTPDVDYSLKIKLKDGTSFWQPWQAPWKPGATWDGHAITWIDFKKFDMGSLGISGILPMLEMTLIHTPCGSIANLDKDYILK